MSDAQSPIKRRNFARLLIAVFGPGGLAVGAGVVIFASPPAVPTGFSPCHGNICVACVLPTQAQCLRLVQCGGEPCPDLINGVDPYAGVAGRLARGLRETAQHSDGAFTFHTDVDVADGGIAGCATVLYMTRDARAAWLRTVNATAGGSEVVDCRVANAPAAFKRAGVRRSTLAGLPADGTGEEDPDTTVGPLDAGPE